MLQGVDVREVFETVLPEAAMLDLVEQTGFQKRERKLDAIGFLRAMVIAASTGQGGVRLPSRGCTSRTRRSEWFAAPSTGGSVARSRA